MAFLLQENQALRL